VRKRKLTAVVACYKDNQAIPVMHDRLKKVFQKIDVSYEIIFVNDNSPDDSEEIIREITKKDKNVIGISHTRNFGSQSAFLSGMKVASGDAVILLDGDLQDPPELIEEFYNKWISGYDIVYGVRTKREVNIFMQLAYKGFYRIFNKVASFKVPVDAGDFSLIDRKFVKILADFSEYDIFIRAMRAYVGGKQIGVNYIRPERLFGTSTNNFLKNLGWASKGILSVSRIPLSLMSLISIVGFIFTLILLISITILTFTIDRELISQTKLLLVLLSLSIFISSLSFLAVGINGEYIGRILEESKKRPKYLVGYTIKDGKVVKKIEDK
jgi:dolichol-phosphate mannosyltransferase